MRGFVDDAIAVGSGRLEPPAVQMSSKIARGLMERKMTYSPTSKPRWPMACALDGLGAPSTDQADFDSYALVNQATDVVLGRGVHRPVPVHHSRSTSSLPPFSPLGRRDQL